MPYEIRSLKPGAPPPDTAVLQLIQAALASGEALTTTDLRKRTGLPDDEIVYATGHLLRTGVVFKATRGVALVQFRDAHQPVPYKDLVRSILTLLEDGRDWSAAAVAEALHVPVDYADSTLKSLTRRRQASAYRLDSPARGVYHIRVCRDAILRHLRENGPQTKKGIAEQTGISPARVDSALLTLRQHGEVDRDGQVYSATANPPRNAKNEWRRENVRLAQEAQWHWTAPLYSTCLLDGALTYCAYAPTSPSALAEALANERAQLKRRRFPAYCYSRHRPTPQTVIWLPLWEVTEITEAAFNYARLAGWPASTNLT